MRWWTGFLFLKYLFLFGNAVSPENLCAQPSTASARLPVKFTLDKDSNFQVNIRITNWKADQLYEYQEVRQAGKQTAYKKNLVEEALVSTIRDQPILYNFTDGSCSTFAGNILPFSNEVGKYLNASISSALDLSQAVIAFGTQITGYVNPTSHSINNGVEGAEWFACVNTTTLQLQVRIMFAGETSIPPIGGPKNPLPLVIRFTEFKNISSNVSESSFDVSYTFSSFNAPNMNLSTFKIPEGICNGLKVSQLNLAASLPDQFLATITHSDMTNEAKDYSAQLLFSPPYVGVSAKNGDIIMALLETEGIPSNSTTVLHDFWTGLESYFSSSDECIQSRGLRAKAVDVTDDSPPTHAPHYKIFIPNKADNWSQYDDLMTNDGRVAVYRAPFDSDQMVEVRMEGANLSEILKYKKENNNWKLISKDRIIIFNFDDRMSRLSTSCYPGKKNSTFSLAITDDYSTFKSSKPFTKALLEGIDQLSPITPQRIKITFVPSQEDKVKVVLTFSDPIPNGTPTKEKHNETSVDDIIKKLNETITKADWKLKIPMDERNYEWTVSKDSFISYPSPESPVPSGFAGYTGGAMFVLAIFMLLFGVGLGAGGLFFITRRQRISTFAYQVFE